MGDGLDRLSKIEVRLSRDAPQVTGGGFVSRSDDPRMVRVALFVPTMLSCEKNRSWKIAVLWSWEVMPISSLHDPLG